MEHNHIEAATASRPRLGTDTITYWIILALVFLGPLFFIPSAYVPFQFSKVFLVYIGVIASFCAWTIARLKDGKLVISRHPLFLFLAGIVVAYGLSAIFSSARSISLIGQGYEVGTFSFVATLCVFTFLVAYIFRSKGAVAHAYTAFLLSSMVVGLIHIIRLLIPSFLAVGPLASSTASIVGGWYDLGIFIGGAAIYSFLTLELLRLPRWLKNTFVTVLVLSLFLLSVISFPLVWYILGVFALIFFIYNFSFNKSRAHAEVAHGTRSIPLTSLIVMIVAFIFILTQNNIYGRLSAEPFNIKFLSKFAISNVEVRPSFTTTVSMAKDALMRNPIFGIGPNRFTEQWNLSRPADVVGTEFWSVDFNYGIGLIPTFLATSGLLGIVAWIGFFVFFLYTGFKALFVKAQDSFAGYILVSSFIIALYFWLFAFAYIPSAILLLITFFFTGVFIAALIENNLIKVSTFHFIRDPRTSFVSILGFVLLLLGVVLFTYGVGKRFIASIYYSQALGSANIEGNIEKAEQNLNRAVQFAPIDMYFRTLSELNLIKISALLNTENISQDILQNQFRTFLATAEASAQAAINAHPTNYENWLALGRVYEAIVPLNIEGAYESAQASYARARELNPRNPAIILVTARLDVAKGEMAKAKEKIAQALQLKSNYTDAIFFLSQIQATEGDLKSAIQSVEAAALLTPNNPGVYFQLGLLRYNDKNFQGAASAFEQAVALAPEYANARYFLGLSYDNINRTADAISQFEIIKQTNPENQEVDLILANLKAGRDPFANARPPIDNAPEKRTNPPIKEEDSKSETTDR